MSEPASAPRGTNGELELRCVREFVHERFVVPSYQRGYRWTEVEVHALLDDILDFVRTENLTRESFYCLQPVVVLRVGGVGGVGGVCHVIDGQQRLTTLRLLLTFLKSLGPLVDVEPYSIEYDSRPAEHSKYLDNPSGIEGSLNIDLHHFKAAYRAIESWFEKKTTGAKLEVISAILNSKEDGKNVKVIWYELDKSEPPIDVFVRLNIGKIRLTNAELIRALLLNGKHFRKKASDTGSGEALLSAENFRPYEIAQEWDAIERDLQSDRYWHFLQGVNAPPPSRIELIFELLVRMQNIPIPDQEYGVFFAYSALTARESLGGRGVVNAGALWWQVKRLAMRLDEWFRDRRMYHLVGCLVSLASAAAVDKKGGSPRAAAVSVLVDALRASEQRPRAVVRAELRNLIRARLFGPELSPHTSEADLSDAVTNALESDEFEYSDTSRGRIRSLLLTFNVATHLRNVKSNLFFPFDAFQDPSQSWDIEHIRATMDRMPHRPDDQKAWLQTAQEYLVGLGGDGDAVTEGWAKEFSPEADKLLGAATFDNKAFEALYRRSLVAFGGADHAEAADPGAPGSSVEGAAPVAESDDGDGASVYNLALLDSGTNRGIKHSLFPIKRRLVLKREHDGLFVPVCTRNVFLKYYTQQMGQVKNMLYWNNDDRKAYGNAMVATLTHFFLED